MTQLRAVHCFSLDVQHLGRMIFPDRMIYTRSLLRVYLYFLSILCVQQCRESDEEGEHSLCLHGVTSQRPTSIHRAPGNMDGKGSQHLGAKVAKAKSWFERLTMESTKGFGPVDQSESPNATSKGNSSSSIQASAPARLFLRMRRCVPRSHKRPFSCLSSKQLL